MFFERFSPDPETGRPSHNWLLETTRSLLDVRRWFSTSEADHFLPNTYVGLVYQRDPAVKAGQWVPENIRNVLCLSRGTGKSGAGELKGGDVVDTYAKLVRDAIDAYKPSTGLVVYVHPSHAEAAAKGIAIACLEPGVFKTKPDTYFGPDKIQILPSEGDSTPEFEAAIWKGLKLGAVANVQRFLMHLPLNHLGIAEYATLVYHLFGEVESTYPAPPTRFVSEPQNADMERMRLLQATCRASGRKPRVILITIHPASGPTEKIRYLVGKGLVTDNGGECLKISGMIAGMKSDMGGSAAVLANALYFKEHPELLGQTTVFVLALAENRIDGNGCAVEDVVVMYDGSTYEDVDTDAEGRKVLADVLLYLSEQYKGKIAPDPGTVATLTGGAVLAFGTDVAPIMVRDNDRDFFNRTEDRGGEIGDRCHRLAITPEHTAKTASGIADALNVPSSGFRNYGAQRGGASVLKYHPKEATRAFHLDIARATSRGVGQADMPQHAGVWLLIDLFSQPPMKVSAV